LSVTNGRTEREISQVRGWHHGNDIIDGIAVAAVGMGYDAVGDGFVDRPGVDQVLVDKHRGVGGIAGISGDVWRRSHRNPGEEGSGHVGSENDIGGVVVADLLEQGGGGEIGNGADGHGVVGDHPAAAVGRWEDMVGDGLVGEAGIGQGLVDQGAGGGAVGVAGDGRG